MLINEHFEKDQNSWIFRIYDQHISLKGDSFVTVRNTSKDRDKQEARVGDPSSTTNTNHASFWRKRRKT